MLIKCPGDSVEEDVYDPEEDQEPNVSKEYIPIEYKIKAVEYVEAHPNYSLKTLHGQGFKKLKRKDCIIQWKKDIQHGGTFPDKMQIISLEVWDKFKEARANYEKVTTRTLRQWAMSATFPFIDNKFHFSASMEWIKKFKRIHGIKQRKITKFIGKADIITMEDMLKTAINFQKQTSVLIPKFSKDFVINTDQTGCQYNAIFKRTLDFQGVRDVHVRTENLTKMTHSYTAQYSIAASGKLLPKVFLCLQEQANKFGPRVSKHVDTFSTKFGNVVATCSK